MKKVEIAVTGAVLAALTLTGCESDPVADTPEYQTNYSLCMGNPLSFGVQLNQKAAMCPSAALTRTKRELEAKK